MIRPPTRRPRAPRRRGRRRARHAVAVTAALTLVAPALALAPAPAATAASAKVSLRANQADVRASEEVALTGRVLVDGSAPGRVRVALLARTSGSKFSRVQVARTGPAGRYSFLHRRKGTTQYRVRYERPNGSALARSRIVTVQARTAPRRVEERRASWPRLGRATSGVRTARRFGKQVRFGQHARGVVAQVGANSAVVRGAIWKLYRKNGGIGGALGAPVADVHCQLLGKGCLQRFQRGAIYVNPRAPRSRVVVSGHPPARAAYIAVGRSQIGYVEPAYRKSKFNAWMGSDRAWCGFFQSWVSRASGNGDWFPKAKHFNIQVRKVERRGTRLKRPRVGAIVFFDYVGRGRPSHVGFVTAVHGNGTITTLEGNTGPRSARGIVETVRSTASVHSYWIP